MEQEPSKPKITELLHRANEGDASALDEVFDAVYSELLRLAHAQRRKRVTPGETLSTTALVHETYLKLAPSSNSGFADREHFMAVAAKVMRQILVDSARKRHRQKRGGGFIIETLAADPPDDPLFQQAATLIAVDTALTDLQKTDERLHTVIECQFFGGMTQDEIASLLNCSARTIRRDWIKARAWLRLHLGGSHPSPVGS